jgi:hypothetical protein
MVANNVSMKDAPEAYGWINTGQLVGYSAAAALAGIAIDTVDASAALLVALTFGMGASLVSVITTKSISLLTQKK